MSVNRSELLERIAALSQEDLDRVAPYVEADLDAVNDLDALHEEIELGRRSAAEEPLIDDDEVAASILAKLDRR